MGQLMEVMQVITRGQEEMRQANLRAVTANPAMIHPVNPLGGASTLVVAQPPLERGLVYLNVAQTFNIPVSGRAQPVIHDH